MGKEEKKTKKSKAGRKPKVDPAIHKHTDIKRTHLHVVSVRVDENGKKLDSNFENIRSMKVCRQLEQEFNLHSAANGQRESIIPTKKIDYKAGDIKHQVSNITKSVMSNFHFQSFGEYRTLLEVFNLTVEKEKIRENIRPIIANAMRQTNNQEDFRNLLLKNNISVIFR